MDAWCAGRDGSNAISVSELFVHSVFDRSESESDAPRQARVRSMRQVRCRGAYMSDPHFVHSLSPRHRCVHAETPSSACTRRRNRSMPMPSGPRWTNDTVNPGGAPSHPSRSTSTTYPSRPRRRLAPRHASAGSRNHAWRRWRRPPWTSLRPSSGRPRWVPTSAVRSTRQSSSEWLSRMMTICDV
jgi:hypothetical protein